MFVFSIRFSVSIQYYTFIIAYVVFFSHEWGKRPFYVFVCFILLHQYMLLNYFVSFILLGIGQPPSIIYQSVFYYYALYQSGSPSADRGLSSKRFFSFPRLSPWRATLPGLPFSVLHSIGPLFHLHCSWGGGAWALTSCRAFPLHTLFPVVFLAQLCSLFLGFLHLFVLTWKTELEEGALSVWYTQPRECALNAWHTQPGVCTLTAGNTQPGEGTLPAWNDLEPLAVTSVRQSLVQEGWLVLIRPISSLARLGLIHQLSCCIALLFGFMRTPSLWCSAYNTTSLLISRPRACSLRVLSLHEATSLSPGRLFLIFNGLRLFRSCALYPERLFLIFLAQFTQLSRSGMRTTLCGTHDSSSVPSIRCFSSPVLISGATFYYLRYLRWLNSAMRTPLFRYADSVHYNRCFYNSVHYNRCFSNSVHYIRSSVSTLTEVHFHREGRGFPPGRSSSATTMMTSCS